MRATIPGTGLVASRLGLGTESLHRLRGRARADLLDAAYDLGVRYVDSAPLYGHGIAEREVGRFVARCRARGGEGIVVGIKVGRVADPLLTRFPALVRPNMILRGVARKALRRPVAMAPHRFDPAWLRESVEASLSRLGVDCIDIAYLHEPPATLADSAADVAAALQRMISEGKVRTIGISGHAVDALRIAARQPDIAAVVQVDARDGRVALEALRAAGRPVQVSFEHLAPAPGMPAAASDLDAMRAAAGFNESGVIVVSTPDRGRLADCARALDNAT